MIFGETILLEQGSVIWKYPCKIEAAHKNRIICFFLFPNPPISPILFLFLLAATGRYSAGSWRWVHGCTQAACGGRPAPLPHQLPSLPSVARSPFPSVRVRQASGLPPSTQRHEDARISACAGGAGCRPVGCGACGSAAPHIQGRESKETSREVCGGSNVRCGAGRSVVAFFFLR